MNRVLQIWRLHRYVNWTWAVKLVGGCLFILMYSFPVAAEVTIVVLGDSLVAGTGLDDISEAFPARLEIALQNSGVEAKVHNAGLAGDTSAGGRRRLAWSLVTNTDLVILELGANDALRGIDPDSTYANLDTIVITLRQRSIGVLLAGMLAPPNLGQEFGTAFREVYERIADNHDVVFYPFFLDGVVANTAYLQRDGMHPNAEGVDIIVSRILPTVLEAIAILPSELKRE